MDGCRWLTGEGVESYEENSAILENATTQEKVNHMPDKKKVFVVHGRDSRLRDDFFSFLRALDLQPIEWSEALKLTGKATPYIGEAIECAFKNAQAVIVLLSPDDEVRLSPELWKDKEDENEKEIKLQARPNVLFEAGMAFGMHHDRTVLVEVGQVKAFSDVAGRYVVKLSNLPNTRNDIATRLKTAGCDVSTCNNGWLNIGNFNINRDKKSEFVGDVTTDINEEIHEEYGVYWNKKFKKRCLKCKSPLIYASNINSPSVFFCSKCNRKHVLKETNGNLITEQKAIEKLKNANIFS